MTATPTFNHLGLCVTDRDRSRRFYEAVLGFEHTYDLPVPDAAASPLLRVPAPVGMTAVYLRLGAVTLELLHFDRDGNAPQRERSFTEPGLTHLSFTVEDLDATCALTVEHGGAVLDDTRIPGIAVMITDPDGQILELLAPRRRS